MKTPPPDATTIRATWILKDPGETYEYRGLPGTLARRGKSIAFDLRETGGWESDFEAMLVPAKTGWQLRFESLDGPEELGLREFSAGEEVILFHDSLKQTVYLHLPMAVLR